MALTWHIGRCVLWPAEKAESGSPITLEVHWSHAITTKIKMDREQAVFVWNSLRNMKLDPTMISNAECRWRVVARVAAQADILCSACMDWHPSSVFQSQDFVVERHRREHFLSSSPAEAAAAHREHRVDGKMLPQIVSVLKLYGRWLVAAATDRPRASAYQRAQALAIGALGRIFCQRGGTSNGTNPRVFTKSIFRAYVDSLRTTLALSDGKTKNSRAAAAAVLHGSEIFGCSWSGARSLIPDFLPHVKALMTTDGIHESLPSSGAAAESSSHARHAPVENAVPFFSTTDFDLLNRASITVGYTASASPEKWKSGTISPPASSAASVTSTSSHGDTENHIAVGIGIVPEDDSSGKGSRALTPSPPLLLGSDKSTSTSTEVLGSGSLAFLHSPRRSFSDMLTANEETREDMYGGVTLVQLRLACLRLVRTWVCLPNTFCPLVDRGLYFSSQTLHKIRRKNSNGDEREEESLKDASAGAGTGAGPGE